MEIDFIPQLEEELQFSRLNDFSFIVSSAKERHFIKINQDTYNLILLIDGVKSLAEICEAYNQIYQSEIKLKTVADLFTNSLSKYGLLKGFDESLKPYQKPSYLKLSHQIINENTVSKIVKFFHFLFNKWTAIILVAISLSFVMISLHTNFNLYQNFNLAESAILLIFCATLSLIFHELGHASATSYFGIKHGGIGIGFYLLTPVFYADVTEVWHLPKNKRIIVNLAGVYFELLFCVLVILVGSLIGSSSMVIVSIIIFVRTLFNLNPFLRSDGYWILTDLVEIPNLMANSTKKLVEAGKLILGRQLKWKTIDFYLFIYGIMSRLGIALFLYFVVFVNPDSILFFPMRILTLFTNLESGNFNISFLACFELLIPMAFIFFIFRSVKSSILFLRKRFFKSQGNN